MRPRVVALAAITAFAVAGAQASAAPTRASLRLVKRAPVTVRGAGFQPREGVLVTLSATRRYVARTRADAGGSFVVTFRGAALPRCAGFMISAVGTAGSRAFVKLPLPLGCLPVQTPR